MFTDQHIRSGLELGSNKITESIILPTDCKWGKYMFLKNLLNEFGAGFLDVVVLNRFLNNNVRIICMLKLPVNAFLQTNLTGIFFSPPSRNWQYTQTRTFILFNY